MLLPWYITGRIDNADRARVERYLEAHPEMRNQLDLIREEQGEVIVANEALGGAPAGALDRLRASITAEPSPNAALGAVGRGLWAELGRLFAAPTPRAVQWAGAAAAILLIAQAAVIGNILSGDAGPPSHSVASGGEVSGTTALMQFAPGATADQITQFLREQRAEIVRGPKPGGIYEVRIATAKLSPAERDAVLAKFKAAGRIVTRVLP